jgi:hypothetical protein
MNVAEWDRPAPVPSLHALPSLLSLLSCTTDCVL